MREDHPASERGSVDAHEGRRSGHLELTQHELVVQALVDHLHVAKPGRLLLRNDDRVEQADREVRIRRRANEQSVLVGLSLKLVEEDDGLGESLEQGQAPIFPGPSSIRKRPLSLSAKPRSRGSSTWR